MQVGATLVAYGQAPEAGQPSKSALNGLIANDKFCLTRLVRLRLSWPRPRVGLRVSAASQAPSEVTHCGEAHETAAARMAGPARHVAAATGQQRWDRAYQLLLQWAAATPPAPTAAPASPTLPEASHARSDLRPRFHQPPSRAPDY